MQEIFRLRLFLSFCTSAKLQVLRFEFCVNPVEKESNKLAINWQNIA